MEKKKKKSLRKINYMSFQFPEEYEKSLGTMYLHENKRRIVIGYKKLSYYSSVSKQKFVRCMKKLLKMKFKELLIEI